MEYFYSFVETLHAHLNPLAYLGILLLASCVGGVLANLVKAPRVIGFLLTGMLFSPSVLGIFHEELINEELSIITHIALSVIAFSIGGSLELTKIKRLGRPEITAPPLLGQTSRRIPERCVIRLSRSPCAYSR